MVLGIERINRLSRFTKAYRRLEPEVQDHVDAVIRELELEHMPVGRDLKKRKGARNPAVYQVRVDRHFRLTFHVADGVAVLRNVGSHDQVRANP